MQTINANELAINQRINAPINCGTNGPEPFKVTNMFPVVVGDRIKGHIMCQAVAVQVSSDYDFTIWGGREDGAFIVGNRDFLAAIWHPTIKAQREYVG